MLSHNQIKYINSLKIKKFRQQHRTFIVEGEKIVDELLKSDLQPVKIYAVSQWLETNMHQLNIRNIAFQEVSEAELKKVSDLVTPNRVLAITEIPGHINPEPSILSNMALALDGIRDPGNMGTIIRTADWFGIRTIICSSDSVDVFNPKVVQATMGSFTRVRIFYLDLISFLKELPPGIPVYGALLEGPEITKKVFTKEGIILIGSESHGISPSLMAYINEPLHIPGFPTSNALNKAESLNASIANGIICYEICKQLFRDNF
jgi:RNA methyltransferase, TrmH family